jgi:hypothetical protein
VIHDRLHEGVKFRWRVIAFENKFDASSGSCPVNVVRKRWHGGRGAGGLPKVFTVTVSEAVG